jgi:hypothetical protein
MWLKISTRKKTTTFSSHPHGTLWEGPTRSRANFCASAIWSGVRRIGLRGGDKQLSGPLSVAQGLIRQGQVLVRIGSPRIDLHGSIKVTDRSLVFADVVQREAQVVVDEIPGRGGTRLQGQGLAILRGRRFVIAPPLLKLTQRQVARAMLLKIVCQCDNTADTTRRRIEVGSL